MATLIKTACISSRRFLSFTSLNPRAILNICLMRSVSDSTKQTKSKFKAEDGIQTDGETTRKSDERSPKKDDWKYPKRNIKQLTDDYSYEVLNADDQRLGRTILRAKTKSGRIEFNEILIEGQNSIVDALQANGVIKALYFSSLDVIEKFPVKMLPTDIPLYKAPKAKLNLYTDMPFSPGILGIFEMPPEDQALKAPEQILPITLVCNGVTDPSSLGSLLQSAAAVGCQRVILMKGCCDYWNGKVIRSSGLSQFYLSIISNVTWAQINSILLKDQPLNAFLLRKERVTPEMIKHYDGSEQAFTRLQKLEEFETNEEDEIYEDDSEKELDDSVAKTDETLQEQEETKWEEDQSYHNFNHLKEYKQAPLTVQCYDTVDFTSGHSVIVVDERYSIPSKKFVYDNEGTVLHFEIASQLYGLTASMAGGLCLFEAGKQFRKKTNSGEKVNINNVETTNFKMAEDILNVNEN